MKKGLLILIAVGIVTIVIITVSTLFLFQKDPGAPQANDGDPFDIPSGDTINIPVVDEEGTDIANLGDGGALIKNTLVKISDGPVASSIVRGYTESVATSTGTSTKPTYKDVYRLEVRYIDRNTGHINSFVPETGEKTRLSNTTVPGVQDAVWLLDGTAVAIRTNESEELYVGKVSLSENSLVGSYLNKDVVAVVPYSTSTVAQILSNGKGLLAQEIKIGGNPIKDLFRTSLEEVSILGSSNRAISISSRPVSSLEGVGYLFKGSTGVLERIGSYKGFMSVLHPQGDWMLIGKSEKKDIILQAYQVSTKSFVSLPLSTLPEKCVWDDKRISAYCAVPQSIPKTAYPDEWYQGGIRFDDQLWELNIEKGQGKLTRSFTTPFDIIGLSLDPKGTYMTFINKNDGSLWGLSL